MKTWQILRRFAREWQWWVERLLPFAKTHVAVDRDLSAMRFELKWFSRGMDKMIELEVLEQAKFSIVFSIAKEMTDQIFDNPTQKAIAATHQ